MKTSIKNLIDNIKNNDALFFENKENNNFYVKTLDDVNINEKFLVI